MNELENKINTIKEKIEKELINIQNLKDLENFRIEFLGKSGLVTQLMPELKNLNIDDKKIFGAQINNLKNYLEEKLKNLKETIIQKEIESKNIKEQNFDVTAYKLPKAKGHLHPLTQLIKQIENIFISMGYLILDGPEVETSYNNFTGVNIPKDHPARDMYDTLWLDKPEMLLRTHTSTVQVRAIKKICEQNLPLPFAGIVPGRTFRHESIDATHDMMFMQCEGIFIDKNVTMSNLFATAKTFLQKLMDKKDLDIRIRPGFFPFVEPGVEIDMRCPFCKSGCSVCKKSTWIEVFPGGLIHPNVLKAGGLDSTKYSGFAFGFGLTRLAMLKYNINDIRYFYGGKLNFLEQF